MKTQLKIKDGKIKDIKRVIYDNSGDDLKIVFEFHEDSKTSIIEPDGSISITKNVRGIEYPWVHGMKKTLSKEELTERFGE